MSEPPDQNWLPENSGADAAGIAPPLTSVSIVQRSKNFMLRNINGGAVRHSLSRGSARLIEIIYPPSCMACRRATMQAATLCPQCWSRMPFIERPWCERLGTPFQHDGGPGLISPEAFANPPVFHRARAVARFEDGPVRDLVHNLKYGDRLELAKPMGLWMARTGAELLAEAELMLPIPLHRRRLFSRRFNQAAALAQIIAAKAGLPFDPLVLARIKPTPPQVGLTRVQRADNVQGAFLVHEEARPRIYQKKILLVDDVLTSGATTNAAARILLRAGAAQVDVLVFARVVTQA